MMMVVGVVFIMGGMNSKWSKYNIMGMLSRHDSNIGVMDGGHYSFKAHYYMNHRIRKNNRYKQCYLRKKLWVE